MKPTHPTTVQLYDIMRNMLMSQGQNYWQAMQSIMRIDLAILSDISHQLIDDKDPQALLNVYEALGKSQDSDKLAAELGISHDQLVRLHYEKLYQCWEHLDKLLKNSKS